MKLIVDGELVDLEDGEAEIVEGSDRLYVRTPEGVQSALVVCTADESLVSYRGRQFRIQMPEKAQHAAKTAHSGEIHAPMPGQIVAVHAQVGDAVSQGAKIIVLEAMKMQQSFEAPFDGTVEQLPKRVGAQVAEGELLAAISPSTSD